ncbi:cytochrome P450 6k1-like isoform X2 [Oratosquilla oratoria]|uniref:cytochrome P450 6k1-like isoform X2 n=1 Tax=Oratosquilla oratoria TaxID=337810 RepID=UPI003F7666BF
MLAVLILALTLVVLLLGYCHHLQQYWQSKGVYVPPMLPVLGHLHFLFSRRTNEIMSEYLIKSKVPYMGWYEGVRPILIVHDLALLKNILVKDFDHFVDRRPFDLGKSDEVLFREMLFTLSGEKWKRMRSTMSPTFTSGKLKGTFPLIEAKCKKLVEWCLKEGTTRDKVEMHSLFNRFTLDTITTSAFRIETNCIDNEKEEFATAAEKITSTPGVLVALKFALLLISPRLFNFLRLRFTDPAVDIFSETAKATLKMRKNSERRGDFIDLMLEAKQEHDLDTGKSKYQALRLFPPVPMIDRATTKEYTLPGTDVKIEKGTVITINAWGVNRDPRIWEDPDDFKPERFLPENKTPEQSFAFQSFGQGPRNCIGMRFALLETKLALAHLVLNLNLRLAPGHEDPLELVFSPNIMKAKGGINLVFESVQA